jgi:hypothetical protein
MDPPTPATATKTTKDGEHFVLEDGAGTEVETTPATVVTNAPTESAAPDTPTEGADGATDNREDATDAPTEPAAPDVPAEGAGGAADNGEVDAEEEGGGDDGSRPAKRAKRLTPEEAAELERAGDAAAVALLGTKLPPLDALLFCVISKGRAENVPAMERALRAGGAAAEAIVWIVGAGEAAAYSAAGASRALEGGKLCASRNAALDEARRLGKLCVQARRRCCSSLRVCVGGRPVGETPHLRRCADARGRWVTLFLT